MCEKVVVVVQVLSVNAALPPFKDGQLSVVGISYEFEVAR